MNILKIDFKTKEISFIAHTIEDLWIIKSIAEVGDVIKGSSYRRLKNDQTGESDRKPVFVEISIEKQEYSSTLSSLRFTGKIVDSKPQELAPVGEYHTIEVTFGNKFTLIKKEIFEYQVDLLKNSTAMENKINIIVLDDDLAEVFILSGIENKNIASLKSGKHGKRYNQSFDFTPFFEELYSIVSRSKDQLIIAGPGGTKDIFARYLKEKYRLSSIVLNISNTSKSAVNELMSKKEVLKFFENSIIYKEKEMLDRFKENLGKDSNLSIYGYEDVLKILESGACDFIMVSYNLWAKEIDKVQALIKYAEKLKTKVYIVDQSHDEVLKTLNSFGGIISVLRYKVF
jgi:mRNA surveillance protein pelota